jgi:hypothetical protein
VCEACNKACSSDVTHICDQICSDCHQSPPCIVSDTRVHCSDCNRHFRSQKYFDNHKKQQKKKKSICERVRLCDTCHELIIKDRSVRKHECFKRFCPNCMCNRETGYCATWRPEPLKCLLKLLQGTRVYATIHGGL